MSKRFAICNSLHSIFDIDPDIEQYDFSSIKTTALENFDINQYTVCYIVCDELDEQRGYRGNYIYTQNNIFSVYDNVGGLYFSHGIKNGSLNANTAFELGTILPVVNNKPWSISYNIMVTGVHSENASYDVYLYGVNSTVTEYFAYNFDSYINENEASLKYHWFKSNLSFVSVGVGLLDVFNNNTTDRNLCIRINSMNNCKYSHHTNYIARAFDADTYAFSADYQGFVEQNNNSFVQLSNVKINSGQSVLLNIAKVLYGLDINGNCMPIVSQTTSIPQIKCSDANKVYQPLGFDFHKGIFYSEGYNGTVQYVEGNLYEEYSGIKIEYTDTLPTATVGSPVYITGELDSDNLFHVVSVNYDGVNTCLTQSLSNLNLVYWMIGYLQKDLNNNVYLIDLLTVNNLYALTSDNKIRNILAGTISMNISGSISAPTFYGTQGTVSVSGTPLGSNSDSAVTIEFTTTTVSTLADVGSLPSLAYSTVSEEITHSEGTLPTPGEQEVVIGYNSATAAAQTFTGSLTTFTGQFTPTGTISAPVFTGDNINIVI